MPHPIRLRGPWEYEPLARTEWTKEGTSAPLAGNVPPPGKITLPSDWGSVLGPEFRGRVCFRRRFNKPTGLTELSTVGLIVEAVDYFGRILLNDTPLGKLWFGDAPGEYDITALLGDSNLLAIEVELPALSAASPPLLRPGREHLPGGIIGEVRLEIYD